MALTSTLRFRPFSHISGAKCLLPGSSLAVQAFASCLDVFDEEIRLSRLRFLDLGPLEQFTVLQDLEAGKIVVSGFAKAGFVRYVIQAQQEAKSWAIHFEKLPSELCVLHNDKEQQIAQGQTLAFGTALPVILKERERLFLGVDKSQEWPQVVRRCHIPEVLPFLYWLSQSVILPVTSAQNEPSLIKNLQEAIEQKKGGEVLEHVKAWLIAGFGQERMPRRLDAGYHGYSLPVAQNTQTSALTLLAELQPLIRSLFFQEQKGIYSLLPLLPPECPSGTLSDIITSKGHKFSIEWTKHLLRRVQITAACDDELSLSLQKELTGFRCEHHHFSAPSSLKIRKGQVYLLDNFQK